MGASPEIANIDELVNRRIEELLPQKLEEAIAHFEKNNLQGHEYVYLDSAEYCGNCVRVVLVRLGKTTPEWKQEAFVRYNTFQRFDPFRSFTDVDIPLCAHVVSSD